jgi:hypothetical protein
MDKSIILKPVKGLILPENIPAKEAVRTGLAFPPRKVGKVKLPAIPAGMGVFAKFVVQVLNEKGNPVLFRSPVTGRMVKKLEGPCHSFVRNFGLFQRGYMQNLDSALNVNETVTDSAGSPFVLRLKGGTSGSIAQISALAHIKFGNSSAALDSTQTNLQGTLLGPTTFGSVTVTLVQENTVSTIFTVAGQVTNGTGGSFTVQEMGLFGQFGASDGTANHDCMILRDLTGAVVVANGQTIIGTYTFTIAV